MSEVSIPKWLSAYLNGDGLKRIEEEVQTQELKTNGEIVPMVVKHSSTIGHVPLTLFLAITTLFLAFDVYHLQLDWLGDFPGAEGTLMTLDAIFILGLVWFFSQVPAVLRLLTPMQDQLAQVEQRAMNEFYNVRVHHTEANTGILIFVSLLERQAVVLGDDPISEKLPAHEWENIVEKLLHEMKRKDLATGMGKAISMVGEKLASHFPKTEGNQNELNNHLVIKD